MARKVALLQFVVSLDQSVVFFRVPIRYLIDERISVDARALNRVAQMGALVNKEPEAPALPRVRGFFLSESLGKEKAPSPRTGLSP